MPQTGPCPFLTPPSIEFKMICWAHLWYCAASVNLRAVRNLRSVWTTPCSFGQKILGILKEMADTVQLMTTCNFAEIVSACCCLFCFAGFLKDLYGLFRRCFPPFLVYALFPPVLELAKVRRNWFGSSFRSSFTEFSETIWQNKLQDRSAICSSSLFHLLWSLGLTNQLDLRFKLQRVGN